MRRFHRPDLLITQELSILGVQLNALYGCHGDRFSEKNYDDMILRRFIYYCGKFHTDTINQTIFGKEFVELVWGK